MRQNIALSLRWVPSALNPADQPSRAWSDTDVMVSQQMWERIQTNGESHKIDLMALDSNTQCSRHYTPFSTPCSSGINFFAQNPSRTLQGEEENSYLFPPTYLIGPALQHIRATGAKATLIVPNILPRPYWWPILRHSASEQHLLAKKGNTTALVWPSKTHGFQKPKNVPLPWDLWAFRIKGICSN